MPDFRNAHLDVSLADKRVQLDATLEGGFSRHEALLKRFDPGSELVVIPKVGHWVPYEAAGVFNATLLRLLGRQRRWGEA